MQSKEIGYVILEGDDGSRPESVKITTKTNERRVEAIGIVQTADSLNRNGRIYAEKDLFPELTSKRTVELITTGNLKGEDGHPQEPEISRQSVIDPMKVSVKFLELWTEGKDVWARFKGSNTDRGQYFNDDLLDGEFPSFSLRALGSLQTINGKSYVKNIRLITYDRVIYPSHIAYTKGIVEAGTRKIIGESAGYEKSKSGIYLSKEELNAMNENGRVIPIMTEDTMSYIKNESANIKHIMDTFNVLYESMDLVNNGRNVQMVTKTGDILVINLENKIVDEIMNWSSNK